MAGGGSSPTRILWYEGLPCGKAAKGLLSEEDSRYGYDYLGRLKEEYDPGMG